MLLELIVPKTIDINIYKKFIKIKGPLGTLYKKKSDEILLTFLKEEHKLTLNVKDKTKGHFYLSILNKLIFGVWKGYSIKLAIIGVGYKAFLEKSDLLLKIGFSHLVKYTIPKDINIEIKIQKGLFLIIKGNDLQKVNQVAAEIRALKKVEPYKGKGIRYAKENVIRKQGKKTNV